MTIVARAFSCEQFQGCAYSFVRVDAVISAEEVPSDEQIIKFFEQELSKHGATVHSIVILDSCDDELAPRRHNRTRWLNTPKKERVIWGSVGVGQRAETNYTIPFSGV